MVWIASFGSVYRSMARRNQRMRRFSGGVASPGKAGIGASQAPLDTCHSLKFRPIVHPENSISTSSITKK
jgi:hypothetical protein